MNPPFRVRSQAFGIAMLVALATTACSPQSSQRAATSPATPASASVLNAGATTTNHAAMDMGEAAQANEASAPTVAATAEVAGMFGTGKPVTVSLRVRNVASGKPMGPDDFELAHTNKIHVLGVDPSLTDYSHSHPQPSGMLGVWTYAFIPKYNRAYRIWLDVKPVGSAQQYVMLTLNAQAAGAPVEKTPALSVAVGDISATLAFDASPIVGQASIGRIAILRDGKPFAALEPVMGAYGHIVGISEDWKTIAHVHPMGAEPTKESDRGGPMIEFHLEPMQAGFLKLFVQIQVDGRDVFLPFGVTVGLNADHGIAR